MKVTVDRDRCAGNGVCESIAPAVFQLDDSGILTLLHDTAVDETEKAKMTEAVRSCPALALSVEE